MNKVLIIEDSPVDSAILSECLQRAGYFVTTHKSAEEGLAALQKQQPDLLILDVVLPGISGFELCRELKGDPNTQALPILICSTKNSETDKFWGKAQGANAYLSKPIDQTELVRTAQDLLAAKS